jgi:hypothetical protein
MAPEANPPQQPPYTVIDAMIISGIDNDALFDSITKAARIATDIFDDNFCTSIDKTITELESDFKDYSVLSVNQGQIRLNPSTKRNIKSFIYWCCRNYRINESPEDVPFPLQDTTEIICNAKTHKAYIGKSKTISETATPSQFTDKV